MSELFKLQIKKLETSMALTTDWHEVKYLTSELDELKDLYSMHEAGDMLAAKPSGQPNSSFYRLG